MRLHHVILLKNLISVNVDPVIVRLIFLALELLDVLRVTISPEIAWGLTWLMYIIDIALFAWIFCPNIKHLPRVAAFAFTLQLYFTLYVDARLFFLAAFLLVWYWKGKKQLLAALAALACVVDGFVFIIYLLITRPIKEIKKYILPLILGILLIGFAQMLFIPTVVFPFDHLIKGVMSQGYEIHFKDKDALGFIFMMYDDYWGLAGLYVGIFGLFAAGWLWNKGDPMLRFYTIALAAMLLINPYLLADLWRYFMPHIAIFYGVVGKK